MGKSAPKIPVNEYQMSIHMAICHGRLNSINKIFVDDRLIWEGTPPAPGAMQNGVVADINKPSLFGGDKKEGGVKGSIRIEPGRSANTGITLPGGLAARLGLTPSTCPNFYDIAYLWFVGLGTVFEGSGGFVWGANQPQIKPVSVNGTRISKVIPTKSGEPQDYADMGTGDCNPAHMIVECLTNKEWGMANDISALDIVSFQDAAKTLYEEEFGLSMLWVNQSPVEDFVQEILDHIQATIYGNPLTGLITMKLVRDDYDVDTLPLLTLDDMRVLSFQRKSWGETVNEITTTWTNPENEQEETVTLHDLAHIQMQGGTVSDTRNYYGVRNADLAMRITARDLRVAASPLASFELEVNRKFYAITPGQAFKITNPEDGISELVLRAVSLDYGRIGSSIIKISATEDIFAQSTSAYVTPSGTLWVDPSEEPEDFEYAKIITLPAYFTSIALSENSVLPGEYPEVITGLLFATDNTDARSYELFGPVTQPNGSVAQENLGTKTPVGRSTLLDDLPANWTSSLLAADYSPVSNGIGPGPSNFIIIGDGTEQQQEIALIASGTSSLTIRRGMLDTTPKDWPTGTPIYFVDASSSWSEITPFSDGDSVTFRGLMATSLGILPFADASNVSATLTGRPYYPLRPANVYVGGVAYGEYDHLGSTADISVTWANRNRLTEETQPLLWTDASVTPEVGQTTTIEVLDIAKNVLTVHSGLTGTSFDVPVASFGIQTEGFIRVKSVRDGFSSLQAHEIQVTL